ncbi:hypothetical protein JTB14_036378 [Gonioctena quinquepunctata]|nr:hypothetical protein JTB14_036378 [Gonioctena quinquepunctata]
MNITLQRHAAKYIYIIPDGLRELMSDISREVLRSQPENVYNFIADYLEALLITRENARVAARLVQSITDITNTTLEFLQSSGMTRSEANHIVNIIQKTFKENLQDRTDPSLEKLSEDVEEANIIADIINEAGISPEKGEEAAGIIQRAYRSFKERKQKEKGLLGGIIDWRVAARTAIHFYRQTGVTNEEAHRAATLIKAAYKGYYTRRMMKKLIAQKRILEEEEEAGNYDVDSESMEGTKEYGPYENEDRRASDSRAVKINYDTVKPHVDFGDVDFGTGGTPQTKLQLTKKPTQDTFSNTSAVISFALEDVMQKTFSIISTSESAMLAAEIRPLETIKTLEEQELEMDAIDE